MKYIVFFLLFSHQLVAQQSGYKIDITTNYLSTRDISRLNPDDDNSHNFEKAQVSSFELDINLRSKSKVNFILGYRLKQHYLTAAKGRIYSSNWIETTHSIPVKVNLQQSIYKHKVFFICNGGFLIDIMQQSSGFPIILGYSRSVGTADGIWIVTHTYKAGEVNNRKASLSLDAQLKLGIRLTKFLELSAGAGYTRGFRTIAKGYYSIEDPSGAITNGEMKTRGTYLYQVISLRLMLSTRTK